MAKNTGKKDEKDFIRGGGSIVILTLLSRQEMHGYELIRAIETRSEGALTYKEGTLYPLLHQLEKEGAIAGRWEESQGARRRKLYRITPQGKKLLTARVARWRELTATLDRLVLDRISVEA